MRSWANVVAPRPAESRASAGAAQAASAPGSPGPSWPRYLSALREESAALPPPPLWMQGFRNHGSTCYRSAVFHALYSLGPFRRLIRALVAALPADPAMRRRAPLACTLAQCSEAEFGSGKGPVDARPLHGECQPLLPGAAAALQQDTQEFCAALLDRLHNELRESGEETQLTGLDGAEAVEAADEGWNEVSRDGPTQTAVDRSHLGSQSMVQRSLQVVVSRAVRLNRSRRVRATWEPAWCLGVDIASDDIASVEDALAATLAPETVSGVSTPHKREGKASIACTLRRAPPALMLHLKRFGGGGDKTAKLQKHVRYGERLELRDSWLAPECPREHRHYRLAAVVEHRGPGLARGHYVAYCRRQDDNWFAFDDGKVRPLPFDHGVAAASAYLLCYERVDG